MLKKFLIGTLAAVALLVGVTASAAYDFGTTTLKVGSTGEAVKNVQTVVGATPVDGVFGAITKAKVMVWQAAHGLTADGVVGAMTKAAMNGTTTTTTTTTTSTGALSGGAGDADVAHYGTGEKSEIVEGDTDIKALGFKIEAIDSDIAVTNVKIQIENQETATSASKITKYLDSVDIYKGSTKVGSADAADFSKESGTINYTKTIALSGAVVEEGDKDPFYVMLNAIDDIDTANLAAELEVSLVSFRFQDATGVVFSMDGDVASTNDVAVNDASTNDQADVKSSSNNPDASTVVVDDNNTTDDVLALAFKMDVDDDSSDITLTSLPITLTFAANAIGAALPDDNTGDWADTVVDSVKVKIDGTEYDADRTTDTTNGAATGTAIYTVDLEDEDVVLEGGDNVEVKAYVTLAANDTDYSENTTVTASVDVSTILAETDNDDTFTFDGVDRTGGVLTLNTTGAAVSNTKWSVNSTGTIVDFFFTVEADTDDYNVLAADIANSIAGTMVTLNTAGVPETAAAGYGVLSRYSGDSVVAIAGDTGFTVSQGDTTTFRVRYSVGSTTAVAAVAADNGKWLEVTVTSVAGQEVPEDNQTSPTATVNL